VRLLQKLFKHDAGSKQGIVAISFLANGMAIAITRYNENNRPRLVFCDFITTPQQHWLEQLTALTKAHKLEQYDCHVLLAHEQYRNFSIEIPLVNGDELKQAVRWRIAEMLNYPVDQAVIDYYPLPKSNRANRAPLLEVISCDDALVKPLVHTCKQAGLQVKVIDIQETALRNLATLLPENQQGVAVLHLQANNAHIIIEKAGAIYLSRKFDFNANFLTSNSFDSDSQILNERNTLALEIQRSFDYVENYFDIPPITSLAAVLMPTNTENIVNFLMLGHGITARAMDLSAIVEGDIALADSLQNVCAPVIGASLRRLVESYS